MAESKKNSKPKKKTASKAAENRIAEQLAEETKKGEVKIVGQVSKDELSELKKIVRQVEDTKRATVALSNHFDKMMNQIIAKYKFPKNTTIDEDTGVARARADG